MNIFDILSTDAFAGLKDKIAEPNISVDTAINRAKNDPKVRHMANSYLMEWINEYAELVDLHAGKLTDNIASNALMNFILQKAEIDKISGIIKPIQNLIDLGNNLNTGIAERYMTDIVAFVMVDNAKSLTPDAQEVIDYGGPVTNPLVTGSVHPIKLIHLGSNRRWIKFNDVWYKDIHMNFSLTDEEEDMIQMQEMENTPVWVKTVFMRIFSLAPIRLSRVHPFNNNKITYKSIQANNV